MQWLGLCRLHLLEQRQQIPAEVAPSPTERPRQVVARTEWQDRDGRRVLEPRRVEQREHPADSAVAATHEHTEAADSAKGLQNFLRVPRRQVDHLR